MMPTLPMICIGFHLLGDFYLQSQTMAEGKRHSVRKVLQHSLLYAIPFLPVLYCSSALFLTVVLSHLCIDLLKVAAERRTRRLGALFVIDQILHLSVLVAAPALFGCLLPPQIQTYGREISLAVYLLAVGKPVSVMFVSLFSSLRPEEIPGSTGGAGRTIGYLERLLLACLLFAGQGGAIGWVIAAKAFARSRQLSSSPAFCEYFLIGTLFSILSVVLLYGLFVSFPCF